MVDRGPGTVLTLDAGGTSFVFFAIRAGCEVAGPLTLPSEGGDPDACLASLVSGLDEMRRAAGGRADAICCGFPGPADYPAGTVGPQKNLPGIRESLALGPMLEERFGIPVLLHNDADLFVLGEARGGFLPWVNGLLAAGGSARRHRNLFGITLGTGLGAGFTLEGRMVTGDHGGGPEIWCLPSGPDPSAPAEEHASARAVVRSYAGLAGLPLEGAPGPRAIAEIASGRSPGDIASAREAFRRLGAAAGHAAACAVSLLDCPLVVGGGLSGAGPLVLPALVEAMNGGLRDRAGWTVSQIDGAAFDLENPEGLEAYLSAEGVCGPVPRGRSGTPRVGDRRFPVGITRLGTSRAAALGAYAAAIEVLGPRFAP